MYMYGLSEIVSMNNKRVSQPQKKGTTLYYDFGGLY